LPGDPPLVARPIDVLGARGARPPAPLRNACGSCTRAKAISMLPCMARTLKWRSASATTPSVGDRRANATLALTRMRHPQVLRKWV
jgi:hypothetical protein